jgi:hypothetical protein
MRFQREQIRREMKALEKNEILLILMRMQTAIGENG